MNKRRISFRFESKNGVTEKMIFDSSDMSWMEITMEYIQFLRGIGFAINSTQHFLQMMEDVEI